MKILILNAVLCVVYSGSTLFALNITPGSKVFITKTCLYNFDPFKPECSWGLHGYTLFVLFLLKNIDCGYSLEPTWCGGSNEYPQFMF